MENEQQLRVQFNFDQDKSSEETLSIASQVMVVPSSSEKDSLDQILSHLLQCDVSYMYMVADRLVQGSLGQHVSIYGMSTEDIVMIDVIDGGIGKIDKISEEKQNDWISSIIVQKTDEDDKIIIGSYDGTVDGVAIHNGPVKSLDCQYSNIIASAGADARVIVRETNNKILLQGIGHSTTIEALQLGPQNTCVSADFVGMAFLWRFGNNDPILTAKLHSQCVSDLRLDHSQLFSTSWDHTVKLWDYERLDLIHTSSSTGIVMTCLDINNHILAAGGHDGIIRIYDYRLKSALISSFKGGHASCLSAVAWRPSDPYTLLAASHDSALRLWDTRATKPLANLEFPQPDSPLAAVWAGPHKALAGGKDRKLYSFIYLS